jgi:ribonuclease J
VNDDTFPYEESVALIPLGGTGEIGKNLTVVQFRGEILVVDCGLAFPFDDVYGVDIVIPDITYLRENADRVRGIVLTHGHEDHVGALPYVLAEINVPVWGTRLTMGLVRAKLSERLPLSQLDLREYAPGDRIPIGPFYVEPVRVTHSIPETVALNIETPIGRIVFVSDFKIDHTPIDEWRFDAARFGQLGEEGVLALVSDSTNAEKPGVTPSERVVGAAYDRIFREAPGRIIVTMFASNIHRMQQVLDTAARYGKKVAVLGRSMQQNLDIAIEMGYVWLPPDTLIRTDQIGQYEGRELVILATGAQGEPLSALTRISRDEYKAVQIEPGDTVILSATPIPGNESLVWRTVNRLIRKGANVIYPPMQPVHVSGHACQEELKMMLTLVRPKYVIPMHGEPRMAVQYARMAREMNIPAENIFLIDLGDTLYLHPEGAKFGEKVPVGRVLVDSGGNSGISDVVLRDRKHLAQDGLVLVVVSIDKETGEILAGPDVTIRGMAVSEQEEPQFVEYLRQQVLFELQQLDISEVTDWDAVRADVRSAVTRAVKQRLKRRPVVIPVVMEI